MVTINYFFIGLAIAIIIGLGFYELKKELGNDNKNLAPNAGLVAAATLIFWPLALFALVIVVSWIHLSRVTSKEKTSEVVSSLASSLKCKEETSDKEK